ncbi:sugar ABC transporter permease [Candidatus Nomurabacteria bacterium]|nr:sugar ABC transporter permease [Candidatus Nomurabacteria bacterium]
MGNFSRIKRQPSLQRKKAKYAYLFLIPLLFGLIFMFGIPIVRSVIFSMSTINFSSDGTGYELVFNGIGNFYDSLFVEDEFRKEVVLSILNTVLNTPIILIFSFFLASLLNQKFRGRSVVRVIVFLTLVMSSSALLTFEAGDLLQSVMGASGGSFKNSEAVSTYASADITTALLVGGLPETFVEYLLSAVDRIYSIIVLSGVQVLIFLAGLQSIPASVYEAADIEGASGWEKFWKITFPMVGSLSVTTIIYTIIDSFTQSTNSTLTIIQDTAFSKFNFGRSSAMAMTYFIVIIIIIGIAYKLTNRLSKN